MPKKRCGSPASNAEPDALRWGATAQALDPAPGSTYAPRPSLFWVSSMELFRSFDSQLAERPQAMIRDQAAVSGGVQGLGRWSRSLSSGGERFSGEVGVYSSGVGLEGLERLRRAVLSGGCDPAEADRTGEAIELEGALAK